MKVLIAISIWLVITLSTLAVTFGWNPSAGATGYKLYYGLTPRTYTSVLTCSSPTGHVAGLLPGQTYYFAVTAYNQAGESAYSDEVSFIPIPLPPPSLRILPPWITVDLEGSPVLTSRWDVLSSTQFFFRARISE